MAQEPPSPLIVRSRPTAWGFLVALAIGLSFLFAGARALQTYMLPRRVGIFVEPPDWLMGAILIGFALFMFLVGISELVRYLWPSTELVIDRDGISAFGLLGERRTGWRDLIVSEIRGQTMSIKVRATGRLAPPDLRIHFDRLDADPALILAAIRAHRADLAPADAAA